MAQRTVLQNLKEVLELSGSSLEQVVKYNVYLADMKDFAAMNEAYIDFLPQPMPSRSCLQAVAPGNGTVIEIECIAQAQIMTSRKLHKYRQKISNNLLQQTNRPNVAVALEIVTDRCDLVIQNTSSRGVL